MFLEIGLCILIAVLFIAQIGFICFLAHKARYYYALMIFYQKKLDVVVDEYNRYVENVGKFVESDMPMF